MNRLDYLVESIKDGNTKAFEMLIDKYMYMIYHNCYTSLENEKDVEDAVQEVCQRVGEKIGLYDRSKGTFEIWLFTLTKNYLVSLQRKNKRNSAYIETTKLEMMLENNVKENNRRAGLLNDLYLVLTKDEYDLLVYRAVYDLSFRELGIMFDMKEYEAQKAYKEVRKKAKKYYIERSEGDDK